MKRAAQAARHFTRIRDADELFSVLGFSLAGLLGCLVSQAPLDGPAFILVRLISILASAPITALTGLVVGGGG